MITARSARSQRPFDVLLDQQQRRALVAQAAEQLAHLLDQHRHDALRRLVEQDHLRLGDHGAGDRQHLLLAAGHRDGLLVEALRQARKGLGDARSIAARSPALGRRATRPSRRFSAHRQAGHDAPLLRHVGQAQAEARMGRQRQQFLARESAPGRPPSASGPSRDCRVVVLPAPLRPTSAHDLALAHATARCPAGRGSRRTRRSGR